MKSWYWRRKACSPDLLLGRQAVGAVLLQPLLGPLRSTPSRDRPGAARPPRPAGCARRSLLSRLGVHLAQPLRARSTPGAPGHSVHPPGRGGTGSSARRNPSAGCLGSFTVSRAPLRTGSGSGSGRCSSGASGAGRWRPPRTRDSRACRWPQHGVAGARVVVPAGGALQVHRAELPDLAPSSWMRSSKRSVWCSMLTSSQYLISPTPESMMVRSTGGASAGRTPPPPRGEAHHLLDAGAAVPAAVEEMISPARGRWAGSAGRTSATSRARWAPAAPRRGRRADSSAPGA